MLSIPIVILASYNKYLSKPGNNHFFKTGTELQTESRTESFHQAFYIPNHKPNHIPDIFLTESESESESCFLHKTESESHRFQILVILPNPNPNRFYVPQIAESESESIFSLCNLPNPNPNQISQFLVFSESLIRSPNHMIRRSLVIFPLCDFISINAQLTFSN